MLPASLRRHSDCTNRWSDRFLAQIKRKSKHLEELIRTNNPVELSFIRALLEEAGIEFVLLDDFASGVEGSIGAIQRRILVESDQVNRARRLLNEAKRSLDE